MTLHKESKFEAEICAHLSAHGWLFAAGDAQHYQRELALYPPDVLAWLLETQPQAWETLTKTQGSLAAETVLKRLREQLNSRGVNDVLRNGMDFLGLREALKLADFKPALALNPEILRRYAANRLRVINQVRYSVDGENSLDLVLFLNGIPVATAELKSDFTQSVGDAVDQYRLDRPPQTKGRAPEPLLAFPGGALVHFAVSSNEVQLTTRLNGPQTGFIPFNLGNNGGAGNPSNPTSGHRTAYLWERVWERESWLEILGRYIIVKRNVQKKIKEVVFPRYHQLDVTRKLQTAVLKDGVGGRYLIQHSAGSGKTNSIAWTAHFLAELHDAERRKIFDTVIVISDRNVIDAQLSEALFDFQRVVGVVVNIKGTEGSKSEELAAALSGSKKIVVCTIQTFPFALAEVRRLAATQGKRFAVIADEAHSSQSGDASVRLKAVLSPEEIAELEDGGEVSTEDLLAAQMAARADDAGVTFVAFTATPKTKTIELFGTRPDPSRDPGKDNIPEPFHVYSMQQAIEEEFILDVLEHYTSYRLAFRLAHDGREYDEKEVEAREALQRVLGWVRLHPYNISQKVQIIVEHYREKVAPLLDGLAKAMVVVASRLEAVRWQQAIQKYIRARGYPIRTLVAFSGDVIDPEQGDEKFSEHHASLNPNLRGRDIRVAFDGPEYQILLVANKFQTGFNQPLLCGMYVDKRLAGLHAVQTLSRLNRAHPGKDTVYIVDFVNDPDEILKAFQIYHKSATLADITNPNVIFDLLAVLNSSGYYDDADVDRVVAVEFDPDATQGELYKALGPVAERILQAHRAARERLGAAEARGDDAGATTARMELDALILLKRNAGSFVRLYTFLSQIFNYGNTAVEKRAIFFRRLLPLLEFGRERTGVDLSRLQLTHHTLRNRGERQLPLGGQGPKLQPISGGGGSVRPPEMVQLAEIIARVNELFEGDLTDQDKLVYVNNVIKGKLLESRTLRQQAINNTKEQFASSPDLNTELLNAIMEALDAHTAMSTQALNSAQIREGLKEILLNHVGLYESLREPDSRDFAEPDPAEPEPSLT